MLDLSKATSEQFEACLNHRFRLSVESTTLAEAAEPIELELITVETRGSSDPGADSRQGFSLVFRGPKSPSLEQRIFLLAHETLGDLELFLVPVGPDDIGMLYEAVFN